MKSFYISLSVLALLAVPALAGKTTCFEKHVVANYVGGTGTFVTCNNNSTNHVTLDRCETKK